MATITLSYQWNELDKQHQFGVEADNVWIWYHLGRLTIGDKLHIYPYKVGAVIAEYNKPMCETAARLTYNRMKHYADKGRK